MDTAGWIALCEAVARNDLKHLAFILDVTQKIKTTLPSHAPVATPLAAISAISDISDIIADEEDL